MSLFQVRKSLFLIGFICWTGGTTLSQDQTDDQKPKNFKITGQVRDELDRPIRGATASLQFEFKEKCISVVTNDSGHFEILCPAKSEINNAMDLYLWVFAEGYNLKCVRPQMESEQQFLPCEVVLNDEDLIVVRVLDSNGGPCRDAFVEPCHFDVPNGVYYSEQSTGLTSIVPKDVAEAFRVTTDTVGEAELRGIPIRKIASAYCNTEGMLPQLFHFKGKGSLSFKLRPTGKVRGKVVCNETDIPKPDFTGRKATLVAYEKPSTNVNNRLNPDLFNRVQCYLQFELDRNGCFELDGVLAGEVAVRLEMGDSEFQPIPKHRASLDEDDELDLEIEIAKAVLVEGKMMTGDTLEPVNSVRVSIHTTGKEAENHRSTKSDVNGNFKVYLHPGEYTVQPVDMSESKQVKNYFYAPSARVSVTSQMNTCKIPDLLFPPVQRETGKLVDSNGKALTNRRVAMIPVDSNHPIKYGVSDDQGELDIRVNQRHVNVRQQNTRWVLYPKNYKSIDGDVRQYPTLTVAEESPLVLMWSSEE